MTVDVESERFRARAQVMVAVQLRRRGISDERVLSAMERVPRHRFVPPALWSNAYEDTPVAIGEGQTISQPYIVAAMLQAISVRPGDRVLEVGTGSGYQTALLAELGASVYSLERFTTLAQQAGQTIAALGYDNVRVIVGDGTCGLPAEAPFDAIVVSAAAPALPPPLFQQLQDGGRMIIPVGNWSEQELWLVYKRGDQPHITRLEGCRFVPLVGAHGFAEPR